MWIEKCKVGSCKMMLTLKGLVLGLGCPVLCSVVCFEGMPRLRQGNYSKSEAVTFYYVEFCRLADIRVNKNGAGGVLM